ncbi:hypothetical protein ABKN59_003448 [Abortiporus biennis]
MMDEDSRMIRIIATYKLYPLSVQLSNRIRDILNDGDNIISLRAVGNVGGNQQTRNWFERWMSLCDVH